MYGIEGIVQTIREYAGESAFLPVFFICLAACFCSAGEKGKKRIASLFCLSVVFVFNNLAMKVLGKFADTSTYYRFLWAVPLFLVIGHAVTKAVAGQKRLWQKAFVAALALIVFFGWKGGGFFTEGSLRVWENEYDISGELMGAYRLIEGDAKEESPVVIFDMEAQMASRIYNPSIRWGISRNAYVKYNDAEGYKNVEKRYRPEKALIHAVNFGMQTESGRLGKALRKKKVDYIVTFTAFGMDAYFDGLGYGLIGESGSRSVYARKG